MLAKIGLKTHLPEDNKLVEELLDAMHGRVVKKLMDIKSRRKLKEINK